MKEKSKELLLLDQLLVKEMDLLKVKSKEVPLDSKLLEIKLAKPLEPLMEKYLDFLLVLIHSAKQKALLSVLR